MKNYIRKLVSKSRRRIITEEFNIDLSYICDNRIIAMSYPGRGFETFWRNDFAEVKKFLE
jgi:hypothetical protein